MDKHPIGVFKDIGKSRYYAVVSEHSWFGASSLSAEFNGCWKKSDDYDHIHGSLLSYTKRYSVEGSISFEMPYCFFEGDTDGD